MKKNEFSNARHHLGKTQAQMAELLGVSVKGIQSFEQGWRGVPDAVERDLLVLLGVKKALVGKKRPCWSAKKCSKEVRSKCPVWEFRAGQICWFFPVTLCQGREPRNWTDKVKTCRRCEVFQSVFGTPARSLFR